MNRYIAVLFGMVMFAYASMVIADDSDKLKELERAMTTPPAAVEITKKPRTRAIVFDVQPEGGAATEKVKEPVENNVTSNIESVATANIFDCNAIAQDAKMHVVDFTIQFKLGSSNIAPESEKVLYEIAKILSLSKRCVVIEGHTDISGNYDRNMVLSKERAESVIDFISEKAALDKKRFVAVGKGSTEPLKNLDPRSPHNRRVAFKVVE